MRDKHAAIDYNARHEVADQWLTTAERQLRTGLWRPAPIEADIAWDLSTASALVHTSAPPWPEEPLDLRLARLAHCAPAIRLGMLAGGWGLPAAEAAPPGPDTQVGLPALLAAVYPLAAAAERWADLCGSIRRGQAGGIPDETAAYEAIAAGVPGILNHLAHLETFFGGSASFALKLDVVATVDVDSLP
ncbi:hypothetical protein [Amycolatopsis sp. NPDC004079]|uniref:hypothetical protein n=1 Tax=Amycolatopsis sp. NPDC004079 TaxID=3154549 RepID=UPI0033B83F14